MLSEVGQEEGCPLVPGPVLAQIGSHPALVLSAQQYQEAPPQLAPRLVQQPPLWLRLLYPLLLRSLQALLAPLPPQSALRSSGQEFPVWVLQLRPPQQER